jgi:hypothetical protein
MALSKVVRRTLRAPVLNLPRIFAFLSSDIAPHHVVASTYPHGRLYRAVTSDKDHNPAVRRRMPARDQARRIATKVPRAENCYFKKTFKPLLAQTNGE